MKNRRVTAATAYQFMLSSAHAPSVAQSAALLALVLDDPVKIKLCLNWMLYKGEVFTESKHGDALQPEFIDAKHRDRWLWSLIEDDPIPNLLELAGMPVNDYHIDLCYQMIDTGILLPDGKIPLVLQQNLLFDRYAAMITTNAALEELRQQQRGEQEDEEEGS